MTNVKLSWKIIIAVPLIAALALAIPQGSSGAHSVIQDYEKTAQQQLKDGNKYLTNILQKTPEILQKKVQITPNVQKLGDVLREVGQQLDLKLSVSSELVPMNKTVFIEDRWEKAETILWDVLEGTGFRFAISSSGQLVILKNPRESSKRAVATGTITGRVTAAKTGEPLPGANVVVKGTNNGASTDKDGNFEIEDVESGEKTIVANFIGYQEQEKEVFVSEDQVVELNFKLQESVSKLDEVTVMSTGYQKISDERSTGSYSSVNKAGLESKPSLDLLSRLEGQTAGLVFNRSSLTDEADLSIRGRSTIFGETDPLVVVDGFPIEGDLSTINPNNVESINVLKDAAAASIWGVRAANGVVVIETNEGSYNQTPNIEFQSQILLGEKPDLSYLPTMSPSNYVELEKRWFENGRYDNYNSLPPSFRSPLTPVIETLLAERQGEISSSEAQNRLNQFKQQNVRDQYSELFFRNRMQQKHTVNISGGSDWIRYFFSADFDKDMSVREGDSFDRVNLETDNTFKVTPKLNLDVSLNAQWSNEKNNALGLFGFQNNSEFGVNIAQLGSYHGFLPYQQLVDDQGNPKALPRDYPESLKSDLEDRGFYDWRYRPAEEFGYRDNTTKGQDIRLQTNLNYELLAGLETDLRYQFERGNSLTRDLQPTELYSTRDLLNRFTTVNSDGSITRHLPAGDILDKRTSRLTSHTFRGQLNLDKDIGRRHQVTAIAGAEFRDIVNQNESRRFYGYNDRSLQFEDIDHSQSYPQYSGELFPAREAPGAPTIGYGQNRYASYYTNASYTYDRRYTLTASARLDKSSIFGVEPEDRNVPLWSAGVSWNITQEDFFESNAISQLKLRTTYGFNGNIDESAVAFPTALIFRSFETQLPFARIQGPANKSLTWEKQKQINIGLDFGLWDGAINGKIDGFYKKGEDLLGDQSVDPTNGWSQYTANIASMRGYGYDIEINASAGEQFQWSTKLTMSHATDEVTNFSTAGDLNVTQYMQASREIHPIEGRPVQAIYSFDWAGLDDQGNPQLYNQSGEKTTDYNQLFAQMEPKDLVYNGPANPTYFGGWTHTFRYKGFSLSGTVTYKFGHKFRRGSINYFRLNAEGGFQSMFRSMGHPDWQKRWQEPGDEEHTNVPSYPGYQHFNSNRDQAYLYSEALVEPADHIRLKDVTLSYNLPVSLTQKLPLNRARLYLYADNLGILWRANDHGIDPEAVNRGFARFLPSPLTLTAGIEIEF